MVRKNRQGNQRGYDLLSGSAENKTARNRQADSCTTEMKQSDSACGKAKELFA
jgi:hypothetical protein